MDPDEASGPAGVPEPEPGAADVEAPLVGVSVVEVAGPGVSLTGVDDVPAAAVHAAGVGVKLGVGPKNATRNVEMSAGSPRVT